MDGEDLQISSDENDVETAPCGWSKEEKYILLQALKYSHSNDIERIQIMLPTKSIEEINEVLAYYKKKASEHPMIKDRVKKKRRPIQNVSQVPLSMWAELLSDSFTYKELETETATAVRLLAEFDRLPPQVNQSEVDFKVVYHAIANAMEGKSLPEDKMVNAILEKCIIETAYASKAFIRPSAFGNVMNDINLSDKEMNVFPRPTENHELGTLRHLSSQRRYNPLNISETYLKPSVHNYD